MDKSRPTKPNKAVKNTKVNASSVKGAKPTVRGFAKIKAVIKATPVLSETYAFTNITVNSGNYQGRGFDDLTSFYLKTKGCHSKRIRLDMSQIEFFSADMCAVLGALIDDLTSRNNKIEFFIPDYGIKNVLMRNGFLSRYGHKAIPDNRNTTIPYQKFLVNQEDYFADYVKRVLTSREEIPTMSEALMKKFNKSVGEIFENAIYHSETKLGIFTCGQYFPKKKRLSFTVVDRGIGFYNKIKQYKNLGDSPVEYIDWATKEGHSTKQKVGGLGLELLTKFIDLNQGCLRIISDTGHWERKNGRIRKKTLRYSFPGTVINLEVNTADSSSYVLKSEFTTEDIL